MYLIIKQIEAINTFTQYHAFIFTHHLSKLKRNFSLVQRGDLDQYKVLCKHINCFAVKFHISEMIFLYSKYYIIFTKHTS